MKINIVTVSSGWILQKISERIKTGNTQEGVEIEVSHQPDYQADVNYYADLQNCYYAQKTKCDVAYFTHAHEDSRDWARDLLIARSAFKLDGIVSMNKRYTDMLISLGIKEDQIETIVPGETRELFPLRKIKIGIVSRGGYEGYGQFFMEKLMTDHDLSHFQFNFLGNGWDRIAPIAQHKNIDVNFFSDADYSVYPKFYEYIDYLLIPGVWTAGPMSMQEALSTGIPIIAADVGFVNYEFKADHVFPPNNTAALHSILKKVLDPRLKRREQVESMSWSTYANQLIEFCDKVRKRGTS